MDTSAVPPEVAASLVKRFEDYSAWRADVAARIVAFRRWLHENELADAQTELRIAQLLERLRRRQAHIAFVAEFSRGKSELINAIFFADYGRRLLPSSRRPHDDVPDRAACRTPRGRRAIRLLPIETRAHARHDQRIQALPRRVARRCRSTRATRGRWSRRFARCAQTKRVPIEEAQALRALRRRTRRARRRAIAADGMVEIPRWRHAVINFPHPLLEQGLVILDTPGLNAIGTEPELTLNLLPNAARGAVRPRRRHRRHEERPRRLARATSRRCTGQRRARYVVLNKIDTPVGRPAQPRRRSTPRSTARCAFVGDVLRVPADAGARRCRRRRGWSRRSPGRPRLLARSRLPALEHALSHELIPGKQAIVRRDDRATRSSTLLVNTRSILEARLTGVLEQLDELRSLRGKNLRRGRGDDAQGARREGGVRARTGAVPGDARRVLAAHQHALHAPGHGCAERRVRRAPLQRDEPRAVHAAPARRPCRATSTASAASSSARAA